HIGSETQVAERMSVLFEKLQNPVMTDIAASWPDERNTQNWPNPVPDLYKGEPVVLSARMPKAEGTLTLKGQLAGAPWEVRLPLDAGETRPGIGKLWARRKIEQLEADARIEGNWQAHDGDILKTALDHHLVSRLTSLVAVDVTPARPDGETLTKRDMPVNLPDGWDYEKVFGAEAMPAAQRAAFKASAAPMLAMAAIPASADASGAGLALPQTSTDAAALIHGGLLAIMLAALLAAIFWMQRQWSHGSYIRRRS
ncbi:MAG: marine proteobacterial sortase target protein, partial [Parvibaculum sp.]